MKPSKVIETFTDRYPLVGPAFWLASIQYYLTQVIVAATWVLVPYNWFHNPISDLGNTMCGPYSGRLVCSPLHDVMNTSFVILGLTMISGSVLIYQEFKESLASAIGFSFMALAGLGTILVGLFPENTIRDLHLLGAALPFVLGNLALVILGSALHLPRYFRLFTQLIGVISLVALGFWLHGHYLGLGFGGMERLIAYPQTIWLMLFGLYMSMNHFSSTQ